MRKLKRMVSFMLAGVMSVSLLAGCGSKETAPAGADSTETRTGTEAAVSSGESGEKNLVFGISGTWNTWLSVNDTTTQNQMVHVMVFEPLISFAGDVVYRNAESVDISDDFKTWTVHLREDITWSDGVPTTADDWVWSWQTLTDPEFGPYTYTYYFNLIEGTDDSGLRTDGSSLGVEKIDDYTFEIHWKEATSLNDVTTNNMLFSIYPKHLLEDIPVSELMNADYWKKPVGNGACVIVEEPIIGQEIVLKARDDYYRELHFDQVTYLVVDMTNAANALLNGDIDTFFPELSTDVQKEIDGKNGISFTLDPNTRTIYSLAINNEKYPREVRQAFTMLIDKKIIAQAAAGEEGVPQGDPFLIYQDYYQEYTDVVDVEGAKALLDAAGYDYNNVVTIGCGESKQNIAMIIQQNLAAAGVKAEISTGDATSIFTGQADGTIDAIIMGNNERFNATAHIPKFAPGTGTYTHNKDDYTIYDLGQAINFCTDEAKELELTHELQEAFWDICPWIFLYSIPSYIPTTEKVEIAGSGIMCFPWDIVVVE